MQRKRGQVTIFIVIGIIILAVFGLLMFFLNDNSGADENVQDNDDITLISSFIENCMVISLEESISDAAFQGGYHDVPGDPIGLRWFNEIPFYYDYEGNDLSITLDGLEREVGLFLADEIEYCVDDFSVIKEIGYNVSYYDIDSVDVVILDGIVKAEVHFPVKAYKQDEVYEMDDFSVEVDSEIYNIHKAAIELLGYIKEDMEMIPLTRMIYLGKKTDLIIDVDDEMYGIVIYSIFDNYNISKEVMFNFAVLYNTSNQSVYEPLIGDVPSLEAEAGYLFDYQIEKDKDGVVFEDYTDLFDISKDGLIQFMPLAEDVGRHHIMIKATDTEGNEEKKYITLDIVTNTAPKIVDIPDQKVDINTTFVYQVEAEDKEGDMIFYIADGALNDSIYPSTGIISYYADTMLDEYITVIVVDSYGNKDEETFRLVVR